MERSVHNVAHSHRWILTFTHMPGVTGTEVMHYNNFKLGLVRVSFPGISFTESFIDFLHLRTRIIVDPPEYQPLVGDFRVDEDLSNWLKFLDWGLYICNNNDRNAAHATSASIFTTCILEYLDPWNKPTVKFNFRNCVLTNLSEVQFDYQMAEEDLLCNFTISYDYFTYTRY